MLAYLYSALQFLLFLELLDLGFPPPRGIGDRCSPSLVQLALIFGNDVIMLQSEDKRLEL